MNLNAFFIAALQSALDLGIASPDDVIRHVAPDVLAASLPRPLWGRLLTACVGASRVDAQLVVETLGVQNLCEHVPAQIIWSCIQEIAGRSLGGVEIATPARGVPTMPAMPSIRDTRPLPLATPPPPPTLAEQKPPPVAVGPSIPAPSGEGDLDASRGRVPASQRFRQSSTGIGRLASNNARRPQAQAVPPAAPPEPQPAAVPRVKRNQTEGDFDLETYVGNKDDWKNVLSVEDEQLVEWSAADETAASGDELGRKR